MVPPYSNTTVTKILSVIQNDEEGIAAGNRSNKLAGHICNHKYKAESSNGTWLRLCS